MLKRKSIALVLLVLGVFLLAACSPGGNKDAVGIGSIQGFIREGTENGDLVMEEVTITVAGKTVTVDDGSYEIRDVKAGKHTLKATAEGYGDYTSEVLVKGGEVTVANIVLTKSLVDEINRDLDLMNEALKIKDLDLMMSVHTADAVYELVMGDYTEVLDYDGIKDLWQTTFEDPDFDEYYDTDEPFVHFKEGDIVSATAEVVVVEFSDEAGDGEMVLKFEEGRWKVHKYKAVF